MDKINVLIVEDEALLRSAVKKYVEREGFSALEAEDGEMAIEIFESAEVDFVLLDIMIPKIDGWSVMRRIRQSSNVPVIMMTARGEEYDKLFGFELGVDDYVVKPFSPKELMARMKAVLKRASASRDTKSSSLKIGSLEIDIDSNEVRLDGVELRLTPKEYDLLAFLCQHGDMVFSREQLLNKVWGYDFFGDLRTVDTHIKQLREKLGDNKIFIKTVWGKGYKFKAGE